MQLQDLFDDVAQPLTADDLEREVKIELNGIVGDLVATEAYFVPASDEYPAALHIVVESDPLPSSAVMDDQGTFD